MQQPKTDRQKTADKKCSDKVDCTSCPVCYTFIFQPRYEWTGTQGLPEKNHLLMNTGYTSSYTANVWKPPNAVL